MSEIVYRTDGIRGSSGWNWLLEKSYISHTNSTYKKRETLDSYRKRMYRRRAPAVERMKGCWDEAKKKILRKEVPEIKIGSLAKS